MLKIFNKLKQGLARSVTQFERNHDQAIGDEVRQKWKGTIGIVGLDPAKVARLNKEIVNYGNENGFKNDQHFPDIISVGFDSRNIRHLEDAAHLCLDFGCDVLAIAENTGDSNLEATLTRSAGNVPVYSLVHDFKSLAQDVLESSIACNRPRRPNLLFTQKVQNAEGVAKENLLTDDRNRKKRIDERVSYSGYPLLRDNKFIGVIGGAGPLASAEFCSMLAQTATPFVHYSANSAPGKHLFEIGKGPSYIPTYRSAVKFFNEIGATFLTIPCNTAHNRLNEFCGEDVGRVIDIRKSVLSENPNVEGFILLGTSRTTGVGLPEAEMGTYEKLRLAQYPEQGPFIVPSVLQQEEVLKAIDLVKAGDLKKAKRKIMSVVDNIRRDYKNLPVILACTELPLANFATLELAELKYLDPAESMAKVSKERLEIERVNGKKSNGDNWYYAVIDAKPRTSNTNPNSSPIPTSDALQLMKGSENEMGASK